MTAKAEAEDRRTAESEQFSRELNAAVANHSVSIVAVDQMVARALESGVIDLRDRSRLLSSAWSYAVERFRGWPHFGHLILSQGERSRLATFANDNL